MLTPRNISNETLTKKLIDVKNDLQNEITRCIELNITEENKLDLSLNLPSKCNNYNNSEEDSENEDDDDFINVNDKEG